MIWRIVVHVLVVMYAVLLPVRVFAQEKIVYFDTIAGVEVGWRVENYARFAFVSGSAGYVRFVKHLEPSSLYPVEIADSAGVLRVWYTHSGDTSELVVDYRCYASHMCIELIDRFISLIPDVLQYEHVAYGYLLGVDIGKFEIWGNNPSTYVLERQGVLSIRERNDWIITLDVEYPIFRCDRHLVKGAQFSRGENMGVSNIFHGYFYRKVQ
jgi:hypothetical protein